VANNFPRENALAILRIDNLDDPRLAPYRALKKSNFTRSHAHFVVEGDKLVRRLLDSDFKILSLLVAEQHLPAVSDVTDRDVDVLVVDRPAIEQIVGFNFHRGMLGCAQRKPRLSLREIANVSAPRLTLVACPDLHDPENLGAILRIASALAIDAVLLGLGCCDPFSRRVLRVSMGAALRVKIVESDDLAADLAAMRDTIGLELWAAVTDAAATGFDTITRPDRLALLLGSEGHGLTADWVARCDRAVTIPMAPQIDSFNVAVATGILLYRLAR
jgi:tRNA G18 (ribose-2'-O)-methylase SpoU